MTTGQRNTDDHHPDTELAQRTHELTQVFRKVSQKMRRKPPPGERRDRVTLTSAMVDKRAGQLFATLENSKVALLDRMAAAETQTLIRLQPKTKTKAGSKRKDRNGAGPTGEHRFLCREQLPSHQFEYSADTVKQASLEAANETALMREASVILRRFARELCAQRLGLDDAR